MLRNFANSIPGQVISLILSIAFVVLCLFNIFSVTTDVKVILSIISLMIFTIGFVVALHNIFQLRQKR